MWRFFPSLSGQSGLGRLLGWTTSSCLFIILLLEIWRPHYFLTDDNLSLSINFFTEAGRHLKAGQSIFSSEYVYGGMYDYSRDVAYHYWHPLYLLPSLLADTFARFWILDVIAVEFLVLTSVGFTILAHSLREEFKLKLADGYLVFYTLSFVFSTYILVTAPSDINFLANLSALPWLTLGIMDKKVWRGAALVALFTVHQLVSGYAGANVANLVFMTFFAVGVAFCRGTILPFFNWSAGIVLAFILVSPFVLRELDGFAHSSRIGGLSFHERSVWAIPFTTFFQSLFFGNWSELAVRWKGDPQLLTFVFPYLSLLVAFAAAWCLLPALFCSKRWRPFELLCLGMSIIMAVMIIRPDFVTEAMFHIPLMRSMRWPFRECLQFLFFIHLFILLRPQERLRVVQPAMVMFSALVFLLPLPFIHPFTFNPMTIDRELLLSGKAEKFWAQVKTQLKPTDQIATVINWDYFLVNFRDIPYTLLGTAEYPVLFRVHSISGYSTTTPADQVPLKTVPGFWFGAYKDDQVADILAERPNLKIIRLESVHPLKITMSNGVGPVIDLTPYLEAAGIETGRIKSGH